MTLTASRHIASILIVIEDDATRQLLADHLEADRFQTHETGKIDNVTAKLIGNTPDLVLLDLTANNTAGLELIDHLRNSDETRHTGVIVLSGRGTERDRVRCLERGADAYILKPFTYSELLAHINTILRRTRNLNGIITAGPVTINTRTDRVTVNDRDVRLTGKELALLKELAREPRRVYSKQELLQTVWGYRSTGHTRTLDAHMSRLRRKLDPATGRMAVNCWGVGYRLLDE